MASAARPPMAAATDSAPAAARTPGASCSRGHPASASSSGSPSWVRRVHPPEVGTDGTGVAGKPLDRDRDGSAAAQLGRHLFERDRQRGREPSLRGVSRASRKRHRPADHGRERRRAARARARTRPARSATATTPMAQYSTACSGVEADVGVDAALGPGCRASGDGTRHRGRGASARTRSADAARRPAVTRPAHASGPTIATTSVSHRDRAPMITRRRRVDAAGRARPAAPRPTDRRGARTATRTPAAVAHRRPRRSPRPAARRRGRRATNTTASTLAATCARTAASGSPESASSTSVSSRASASAGPLAWMVDIEPS